MPSAESRIETAQAGRYLAQLCQHADKVGGRLGHGHLRVKHGGGGARPEVRHVEWTDTDGTLALSWGTCTLHADPDVLTVRVEAATEDDLARVQRTVAADLERFGRRDGVAVTWTYQDTTSMP